MARYQGLGEKKAESKFFKLGVAIAAILVVVGGLFTYARADGVFADSANKITNIELMPGQTVYAAPGAEFIVRKGRTTAVSRDAEGIPDVTDGHDLLPGATIEENHLLIFPKDTRGVTADPTFTGEIWIMVRGGFTVYDASGKPVAPVSE